MMSNECFQNIIDAMIENVAVVDETGLIIHINTAWANFSAQNAGHSEHTNTGANYFTSVHKAALNGDQFAKKVEVGIQEILTKKISFFELEYPCHSENEHRWFITNFHEIGSYSPRVFLFTHKDVSSLVAREEKAQEAQRLEAVGQLSGGIAHDFNNLLGIVMGNIELAQLMIDDNISINEKLNNALTAINRGASLIQKLLSFARVQNLMLEIVDVNTFIQNTFNLIKPALGEDVEIKTQFGDMPISIEVDSSMLSNAIINIAINAVHAMSNGGVLKICTSYKELNGQSFLSSEENVFGTYALISISDTGCGINDQDIDKVFEPFFTTKMAGEGSGLGLSMVFGFMKQSNGHIDISSKTGEGSTIFLYFPLITKSLIEPESKEKPIIEGHEFKTVLLVEDNDEIRKTISQILKSIGYKVIQSSNGLIALETLKAQASKIDILLTDVIMPSGISGIDLAKEISNSYPHIKVLLMSGYPHKKFSEANSLPPIINKPFSLIDLADALIKL